jgi:hypothetical protein
MFTKCRDTVDMATVTRENIRCLFVYVDKLSLVPKEHLANINAFTSDLIVFSFLVKSFLQSIWSQLLGSIFNILHENNSDLVGDRRTIMRFPHVLTEGTKTTIFVNFMDLCKTYDPMILCVMKCIPLVYFRSN